MNSISSPTSHASCSTSQASYPDDLINSTLVSLFYLTSDGGFMSKNGYMPCHREKDGKLQIEVITNDYSFWMNAKEISLRLNEMLQIISLRACGRHAEADRLEGVKR